jgi:hypothetical protein
MEGTKSIIMTDYLGNEIKDGMEICWVLVNKHTPQISWYVGGKIMMMQEEENEPCWELGEYIKVSVCENGRPMYHKTVKDGDITYNFTDYLDSPFIDTKNIVLAIKGISDKQPNTNQ